MNIFQSNNNEETIQLGFEFATLLNIGDIVFFYGDLGAGKTQFIKGICSYFKVTQNVTSPTFTIINQYEGIKESNFFNILHIDLFRIKNEKELMEIGYNEFINEIQSIKLIEWAEKAHNYPTKPTYIININISEKNENSREIKILSET